MPGLANSVVTDAGIAAAVAAGSAGALIQITGFTIGSSSAAQGSSALVTDTAVDGLVFTGGMSYVSVSIQNSDTVLFRIFLGQEVGDFNIGQIGLMMGSTLFSKHVLPAQSFKTIGSPPVTLGNVKVFDIAIRFTNIANLLDLSYIAAMYASLPEVDTQLLLPSAASSIYSAYLVHDHTFAHHPAIAVRHNSAWHYDMYKPYPGQGVGMLTLPSTTTLMHASATIGKVVYWSTTNTDFRAYANSISTSPMGVVTGTYDITTNGIVERNAVGIGSPMTPGTLYYSDNSGVLTTTAKGTAIAVAVDANMLYINCGYSPKLGGYLDTFLYGVTTGTGAAYNLSIPTYGTSLVVGKVFWVNFHDINANNATLNLNSTGALNLVEIDGTQILGEYLLSGSIAPVIYDGTVLRIMNSLSPNQVRNIARQAFSNPSRTKYTVPGSYTFTVPANVKFITLKLWGGGASGGGASAGSPGGAASGGGSGAYTTKSLAVVPGDTVAIVVPSGGAGGASAGANGTSGGAATATFLATTYTANGGTFGLGATAGIAQNSQSGGSVVNGDDTSLQGAPSVQGSFSYNGTLSVAQGGSGGTSPFGGYGGNGGAGNGNPGQAPGGGGAGGGGTPGSVATGGAGGNGAVWVEY